MVVVDPTLKWAEATPGDWEAQGPHAYWRIHFNKVTSKYHLGRRLIPETPIQVVGLYGTVEEAQQAATRAESAL